jgi:hypothetical protein
VKASSFGKLYAAALFAASAAVVLSQAARVTALWDLSYILEHAYRISLGELPYRDFGLPHAPLTFLIQAGLIRLVAGHGGLLPHFWYCALIAGFTAILTYRIVLIQLDAPGNTSGPWHAFVVALPTVFLSGYCILPLPFYDPDCVFFVLLALVALLRARRHGLIWQHVVAGALVVLPLLVKQNIGLSAFFAIHGCLLLSAMLERSGGERRAYVWYLSGTVAALAVAALVIQFSVGVSSYLHWTVSYAASRRWPSMRLMLSPYQRPLTWITVVCAFLGYALVRSKTASRWQVWSGLAVIALPLLYATRTMLRWGLAARSFTLWGLSTVAGSAVAIRDLPVTDRRFESALPLIAAAVSHGAFSSQGVADSSYGVWPFLMIGLTPLADRLLRGVARPFLTVTTLFIGSFSIVLLVLGYRHVLLEERLGFVDLSGEVERAALASVRGLATPGTYVSDFERLVRRTDELIPQGEGILTMPGEDPFFFATGRRPKLPIVLFDDTAMPFDTAELMRLLHRHNIRWVVVKNRLQLRNSPWRALDPFLANDLPSSYEVVDELPRYTILRRRESLRRRER